MEVERLILQSIAIAPGNSAPRRVPGRKEMFNMLINVKYYH